MPADDRDQVLFERLAGGDVKAFDEIVARHHPAVGRLVRRLLAWDDEAEDVVQEVFLAAWRHWPRFRGESSLATWLRRIAVNQCRARQRRWRLRVVEQRMENLLNEEWTLIEYARRLESEEMKAEGSEEE